MRRGWRRRWRKLADARMLYPECLQLSNCYCTVISFQLSNCYCTVISFCLLQLYCNIPQNPSLIYTSKQDMSYQLPARRPKTAPQIAKPQRPGAKPCCTRIPSVEKTVDTMGVLRLRVLLVLVGLMWLPYHPIPTKHTEEIFEPFCWGLRGRMP